MPATGVEIEVRYTVIRGKGKPQNGRVLEVFDGSTVMGNVDVLPQQVTFWGLSGLDDGDFTLFVEEQDGKIIRHRFERRSNV